MSDPAAEPVQEQRVDPGSMPQVDLFSHPQTAEVITRRPGRSGDRVDGRAVPFSAARKHSVAGDDADSGVPGRT
jgi:hypothetical protein